MPKSKKTSTTPVPPRTKNASVDIRMYNPGFGDCFLLTFQPTDGSPRYMLIDCGVFVGYPLGAKRLNRIAQDIATVTHNHLDIVVVTHEHADHISGFIDANFHDIQIDDLWLAWTEDPSDTLAQQLKTGNKKQVAALTSVADRLAQINDPSAKALQGLLKFEVTSTGADDKKSGLGYLRDRSNKKLASSSDYHRPGEPPLTIPGVDGVKVYVLGPPRSVAEIHNMEQGDIYPKFAAFLAALKGSPADVSPDDALTVRRSCPFDKSYDLTSQKAKTDKFFVSTYGFATEADQGPAWRRIDDDWLDAANELALRIGDYTNNTSLVLAFELAGSEPRKVLLFVGDAQVGNWLSWPDVPFDIETNGKKETIKGKDLLSHTVFYKTGHHGSHNATLVSGLELMDKSRLVSMIPVDEQWATDKNEKGFVFPAPKVLDAIEKKSQNRVLRSDKIASIPDMLEKLKAQDENLWQDFKGHVDRDKSKGPLWVQYTV